MKILKTLGIISGIIFMLFVVSVYVVIRQCSADRWDYRSYPTYDAAVDAGVIGGYKVLPEFLPPSATDIRYIRFYEMSEKWLFFNFDIEEISEISNRCGRVTKGEIELAPEPHGDFIDWPEEITGDSVRAEDIANYGFYRCKFGIRDGILSVDTEKGKAYYWGI